MHAFVCINIDELFTFAFRWVRLEHLFQQDPLLMAHEPLCPPVELFVVFTSALFLCQAIVRIRNLSSEGQVHPLTGAPVQCPIHSQGQHAGIIQSLGALVEIK